MYQTCQVSQSRKPETSCMVTNREANVWNWFNLVWNFDNNDETVVTLVQWHCTYLLNYHFPEWFAIFFQKSVLSKKKVHSYTSIPPFVLINFLQLMLCLINSYNKTSVIYRLPAVTTMWSWLSNMYRVDIKDRIKHVQR